MMQESLLRHGTADQGERASAFPHKQASLQKAGLGGRHREGIGRTVVSRAE